MGEKDLIALNNLVDEALKKQSELDKMGAELAAKNEQFAKFLEQQKRNQDELDILKDDIKTYMLEHDIKQHDTGYVELKLSPTGRYKCDDVSVVDDSLCKIVKSLDNSKVKAYVHLNGELPKGVEDGGYRLTMKVKES